jgi:Fur family ferric uptake transcriptional regulator
MTHADELKHSGLKATLPRIKVLEVFQKASQRHMSAEDVYKVLLGETPMSASRRCTAS